MQLSHAEAFRRAVGLFGARGRELGTSRYLREVANTFGSVGGDHEVGFASLSRETGQERTDDPFVVGVGENC